MSGMKIAASAPPKFAIVRSWRRKGITAFFLMAIALCGGISSRRTAVLHEPGWFVAGNRTLLSRALTEKVLGEKLAPEGWSFACWVTQRLRGGVNRLSALVPLPLGPLRTLRQRSWRGARSCNLAIWRADLDRIDGFDADYSGWGKEDSDIVVRLLHAGVRRKDGMFATGVLHLWHAEADRSALTANESRLSDIIASDRIHAQRGLSSLGKSPAAAQAAG